MDPSSTDEPLDMSTVAMDLHAAAVEATPIWVRRTVERIAAGQDLVLAREVVDEVTVSISREVDDRLRVLATTDIDRQRTTPLSIFRAAGDRIASHLEAHGARPIHRDTVDPYGIHPANLAEIGPAVHEAGMRWGVAKAALHLQRRRDEGLR